MESVHRRMPIHECASRVRAWDATPEPVAGRSRRAGWRPSSAGVVGMVVVATVSLRFETFFFHAGRIGEFLVAVSTVVVLVSPVAGAVRRAVDWQTASVGECPAPAL